MVLEKICMKNRRYPIMAEEVMALIEKWYVHCHRAHDNIGIPPNRNERDGWTVRTRDRKCAAHFEHTVAIGVGKADILSSFEYVEQVLGDKAI